MLSQWINTTDIDFFDKEIFANNHLNQLTSSLVVVRSIISYIVVDRENIVCFLNFEEMDPPMMITMQQSVTLKSSNKMST